LADTGFLPGRSLAQKAENIIAHALGVGEKTVFMCGLNKIMEKGAIGADNVEKLGMQFNF